MRTLREAIRGPYGRRLPRTRLVELAEAEHDLHLDRPAEWRHALGEFLNSLRA